VDVVREFTKHSSNMTQSALCTHVHACYLAEAVIASAQYTRHWSRGVCLFTHHGTDDLQTDSTLRLIGWDTFPIGINVEGYKRGVYRRGKYAEQRWGVWPHLFFAIRTIVFRQFLQRLEHRTDLPIASLRRRS
jgi:hypothetical protein